MSPDLELENSALVGKLVALPPLLLKSASSHKAEIMDALAIHLGHLDIIVILIKLRVISESSHSCGPPIYFTCLHLSSV